MNVPRKYHALLHELSSPEHIQEYLKKKLIYNHHETFNSFIGVMETNIADCFEGGIGFAYPLLYLHGYNPKIIMLQANNKIDVDHTLVVYRLGNKIGAIAKSSFPTLMDRPAVFDSLRELILTYHPYYTSDMPQYFGQNSLIGYSDPIDLIERFGSKWFFVHGTNSLKYIYDHFTDDVYCTALFTGKRYLYPPEEY